MTIPSHLKNFRYTIYLRRSSDDSDHQIASLPSQRENLLKLASTNGLKVVEIKEESRSAKSPGRPVFNALIESIKNGDCEAIIIWDLSRASRNPVDSGTISWLLQQDLLKVILTPNRMYLPQDNVLIMNVELGMANQYVRDLSQNVKRGLRTKLANGWRPGQAPEGYLNDISLEKGTRTVILDPEKARLVRNMWDLMLTGNYSVPAIQKIANDEWGFRIRKHKTRGGTPLTRTGLYWILTNPFYCGWFKYSGEWYEGKHEKLITQEEFDRVQALLGRKGKQRPKVREFAYTGMIRCAECSAMITAEEKLSRYGHRYTYYRCTKRRNPDCTQRYVELKDLEKQIADKLSTLSLPESFTEWAIKYLNDAHDNESASHQVQQRSIQTAYSDCLKRIDNLIKLEISPMNVDNSLLSEEEFQTQMKHLKDEKRSLEESMKTLATDSDKWIELTQKTFDFARYARHHFINGTLAEKREILSIIGSKLLLQDKKLIIQLPKTLEWMESVREELEQTNDRLETPENAKSTHEIDALYSQNPVLRRRQDSNLREPD